MIGEYERLPFFPKPETGETVYSIICRCIARSGFPVTHLLKELTGQRHKHSLLAALPGYLGQMSARIPIGHPWCEAGQIVSRHTALPFFTYFDSVVERERLTKELTQTGTSRDLAARIGIPQYRGSVAPTHPRYCSICADQDRERLGYAYFRREHQLPSVAICWRHGSVLVHGCARCGPYPITGKSFSMPGKCLCASGITTIPAYENLPHDTEPLLWIASQCAFMVNSNGNHYENIRATIRTLASERNFGRGVQLKYGMIAEAIEERFGKETLKWLGTPVWTEGRPAAWVRRLLCGQLDGKRRSSAILFLLMIGVMFESLTAFEDVYEESARAIGHSHLVKGDFTQSIQDVPYVPPEVPWAKDLQNYLLSGKCDLRVVSNKHGISRKRVIEEVRRRGWRVPLSQQTIKKLGEGTIAAIQSELRHGVLKKDIICRHGCSQWSLDAIDLDDPGLNAERKRADKHLRHEKHRNCLTVYLSHNPEATRTDIWREIAGTYDYLIKHDKLWFFNQMESLSLQSRPGKRGCYRDWAKLDVELAQKLNSAFDEMLASDPKPVRAALTTILKRLNKLAIYMNNSDRLPLSTDIITQRAESQAAFYIRRIKWAVNRMVDEKIPISIDKLRRIASMRAPLVRDHRQLVIDLARERNAIIMSNSFFA